MLTVLNLTCSRADNTVIQYLSFALPGGQSMFVQGNNGAGKTTLLRCLAGLLPADSGQMLWNDENLQQYHPGICAYLGHNNAQNEGLSVLDNMRYQAALQGTRLTQAQAGMALDAIGLPLHILGRSVRSLSQGQRRKAMLTRLWLESHALWLLDEPFVALDLATIDKVCRRLESMLTAGAALVYTSHQAVTLGAHTSLSLQL